MIEAFFISVREGFEIVLVVAVMASVLRQRGEIHLFRWVLWGVGGGMALSLITGWSMVSFLAHVINGEVFEGVMFFVTAVFVAGMAVWVSKTAGRLKRMVADRLEQAGSSRWTLMVMTGLLVWREGTEIFLMLQASLEGGGIIGQSSGVMGGAAVAALVGWQIVRGSARLPMSSIMRVSTGVLWTLVGFFLISGFHELGESGTIRLPHFVWTWIIGPVALHGWAMLVGTALIAVAAEWIRTFRAWRVAVVMTCSAFMIMGASWMGDRPVSAADYLLSVEGGRITVPIQAVTERATWFAYPRPEGGERRLLCVRRSDGVVVAFDTCQNCVSKKGYRQEGGEMICTHCGAKSIPAVMGSGSKSCMPAHVGGPYPAGSSSPDFSVSHLEAAYQKLLQGGDW